MSLAQHVAAKSREIMPIRSSPSSPKSTTATQLVPTTWQNSEIVEIVPYCFTMFHMRAANQLATCLPRKTVLVDLAKAFTYHMHPHAHSDQTQYVGQCRTYSKPAKQLETGRLLIHPSSCCQARQQQARSFPSTGPVSRSTAVTSWTFWTFSQFSTHF